jgi:replication initiation and membrane attachment protein
MTSHWKELLASDQYIVRSNGMLHEYDQKVLTMLYQPLIGATAYSLYMTLWMLIDKDTLWGKENSHRNLMNLMGTDLKQIHLFRSKLEGIGLLNVYLKQEETHKSFIYELQPPLTPDKFFTDGMLEVFLFNRIGKKKFDDLKKQFLTTKIATDEYKNITKSFNEVFETLHASELMPTGDSEMLASFEVAENEQYVEDTSGKGVTVQEHALPFDFQLLLEDLSSVFVPKEAVTAKVKEAIVKLAYIYNINDPLQMSKIIQNAFLHEQTIDINELRKEIQRWYQFEHENKLPFLSLRHQPKKFQQLADKSPQTDEERTIKEYETVTPYDLLRQRSGGGKPALADLKVIESVMLEQGLLPGVVNVLVDYVLYINNLKLPKGYVEKIAAYWARKQVKTVKDAMTIAREENRKYKDWLKQKSEPKRAATRKQGVREDVLPKWMKAENEKGTSETKTAKKPEQNQDKKRSELKDRLKKMT